MHKKDAPAAFKGCSTCTKRRIRCDGGRPTCLKCAKKGLTCPGYGPRLRWADGVAVRGKLKGRRVPLAPESVAKEPPAPAPPPPPPRRLQPIIFSPAAPSPPDDTLQATLRASLPQFIEYYDRHLAGLMVWVDSADNDYRRTVLPRVRSTPGLRLAVAAFASHHGRASSRLQHHHHHQQAAVGSSSSSSSASSPPPPPPPLFHEAARDACLGIIHARVRDMTARLAGGGAELGSQADMADAEWMLACILMIACYELSNSQPAAAEGHRLAARALVNVFGGKAAGHSGSGGGSGGGGLFAFLRSQLAIYDVLASTTSFDLHDIRNTVVPAPAPAAGAKNVLFAEYLTYLHHVTLASRQPLPAPADDDVGTALLLPPLGGEFAPGAVRDRFTQARGATLVAAGRLGIEERRRGGGGGGVGVREDFVRLVDVYHYAAVLYAYRCLGHATPENPDWQATVTKLFEQLVRFAEPNMYIQNLPWPVFVAGTECWGDGPRQETVRRLLRAILGATSFRHYEGVLGFLDAFWSGPQPDWRPLAQKLQRKGFRILVV